MPEIKDTEITEDELLALLERNLDASDPYSESLLGDQRDRNWRYYYGEPFGNEIKGRSQHVSLDVFDAVESTKALLLDTFTADRNVVQFRPENNGDIIKARLATAYVNHLFYRKNNGYKILNDTIHDGLVGKIGVAKRWWDERIEFREEAFKDISEPEFVAVANQPDVEIVEVAETVVQQAVVDPMGAMVQPPVVTYTGKLKRRLDKSQVRVENIKPENLYISPKATSLEDSDFVSYRHAKEIGELLEDGYDEDKVALLDEELDRLHDSVQGRDSFDEVQMDDNFHDDHPNRTHVTVYESYLRIYDPEEKRRVTLKVIHGRRVLLDWEKVESHPYRGWCPFPIPHKAVGLALADVLADIQKSQSSLKRSVIDNAFMTNTTRWLANLSLVRNPRDLIDNKVGAIIDVNAINPGSVVQPMNTPAISPTVFTTMEVMEQEKEARSGSSRMSKGLDSDVVAKQNSSDLITRYMNASNRRTMVMARNFAECFLKPLMYDIYQLALENDKQALTVPVEDGFVQIAPQDIADLPDMTVAVALTPDARAAEARTLTMIDQMFTANPQNPTLNGMYDTEQRFALLSDAIELMGISGGQRYLLPPMSQPYQQKKQAADQQGAQQQQQMMQMEAKKLELEERRVVADEVKVQLEGQRVQNDIDRLSLDVQKASNEFALGARKQVAEDEKADVELALKAVEKQHEMQKDNAELALERAQQRPVGIGD